MLSQAKSGISNLNQNTHAHAQLQKQKLQKPRSAYDLNEKQITKVAQ